MIATRPRGPGCGLPDNWKMSCAPRPSRRECVLALLSMPALSARALPCADPDRWIVGDRPSTLAGEAVAILAAAGDHGLDPGDYGADALAALLATAQSSGAGGAQAARELAATLPVALRAMLADLAFGRVDPRTIHHRFSVAPRAGFDPAAVLALACDRGSLAGAVAAAAPPLPLYRQLMHALAAYRRLADHPAWAQPLPPLPGASGARAGRLDPGQPWGGLALLAERLRALGDLPAAGAETAPAAHDAALVDAVRAFQGRHGLLVDGIVGRATRAALEVTPSARARQIALTMERLRWTPLMQAARMVVVNVPEYTLRGYEVVDGRIRVRLQMRVIVGAALDRETPLFDERMRHVEFSPYWNVPPSIAREETVPRLRRDPGYWQRQGFEFVGPGGAVDTVLTRGKLDAVVAGALRIRQRPGPANALGGVKFVFPNRDAIYLHHTPSTGLFARDRRDLSHGCIRIEDPLALARFALDGLPGWDDASLREAMTAGRSRTVSLPAPLPVLIAYGTVVVKDGRIHFYDDVYGHDARLDEALRRRRPPPLDRGSPAR